MQAAPVVQVTLQRFGVWNGSIALAMAFAVSATGAWVAARSDDLPAWSGTCVGLSLLIGVLGAGMCLRRNPVRLRWDTQRWYLSHASRRSAEVGPAQVQLMIDAGGWMLLKLTPDARPGDLAAHWVPVQRRGIEVHWHALRCAVCSPRRTTARVIDIDGQVRID